MAHVATPCQPTKKTRQKARNHKGRFLRVLFLNIGSERGNLPPPSWDGLYIKSPS